MFEYDEFGNPIPLGTAQVSALGSRRDASGAYTGMMPSLPLNPMSAGNTGGLQGPGLGGSQIPWNTVSPGLAPPAVPYGGGYSGYSHSFDPITGISAGNQNEFFEMPDLGQQVYGLGGVTDYTGGFNTTGIGNPITGISAGNQNDFFEMPSLGQEVGLGGATDYTGGFDVSTAQRLPNKQTMQDFPTEFRSLEGIQEMGLVEEADIPLDFDPSSLSKPDATAATGGGNKMNMQSAGMIASGVIGVAGGVTDIIQGNKNMRAAQSEQAKQQAEINRLKASQPSISTPAEYYEQVKNAYDSRLMQMRTEDINRNLANTTAAASSFGSRGLGALAGATQAANRAQREEVLQQQQLQTGALGELARAQENTIDRREARNVRETTYAQGQLAQAQQNELMAQQQKMAGISSAVGGVAQVGLGLMNPVPLPTSMEDGGKVQKTPGEFSHEENEMAVITENGEDTGVRVTGGEYVLNPDQAKSIKRLVEANDKEGLMRFMDDLLDEPQFA